MTDQKDWREIGERLRGFREYLVFTQDQVAGHLGVNRQAISMMESGQRRVSFVELKKLAKLYEVSVGHLAGENLSETCPYLVRLAANLSSEDRTEILRFADWLRWRRETRERRTET